MDSTNTLPQVVEGTNAVLAINESFAAASPAMVYARDAGGSIGLVWAWLGGRWGGNLIAGDSEILTGSTTVYMVVDRASGAVTFATSTTDWDDSTDYCRAYKITTGVSAVTAYEDHRAGPGGSTFGGGAGGGGGGGIASVVAGDGILVDSTDPDNPIVSAKPVCIAVACSDEITAITAGSSKVTLRMPFAMTDISVRASLTTAQASGSIFTVDINESGSSILSTKLTVDNTEKTSTTAATPAVVSDSSLADDAEITIDVDQVGDGTATGLKIYIVGVPA